MNVGPGVAVFLAGGGAALLVETVRLRKPDPVRRAIGHHLRSPRRHWDPVLDRADDWLGPRRRSEALDLTGVTVQHYRREQLLWVAAAVAAAVAVAVVGGGGAALVVLPAAAVPTALVGREALLLHTAGRTRARVDAQVPAVSELVALAVTAGQAPADAFAAAAEATAPPLAPYLAQVSHEVAEGAQLEVALDRVAARLRSPDFDRLAGTLITATARGVPLATTLLAQAQGIRDRRRAAAMAEAGRREVTMLVPVVFLVLPAVVAVALFPGAIEFLELTV